MIDATVCFIVQRHSPAQVLLGLKKRGFGKGKLNGIGGKVDPGETPEQAVLREVTEEIGVTIPRHALTEAGQITFRFPFKPSFNHFVHVYIANAWEGEPVETDEMAPAWYLIRDLPLDRMWQDDGYWLHLVLSGKTIRAEFEFGEDNETVVSWQMQGSANQAS